MISRKLRKLVEKRYLFSPREQTSFWIAGNASFPIVISHRKGRGVAWLSRLRAHSKLPAQTRNMQTYIILQFENPPDAGPILAEIDSGIVLHSYITSVMRHFEINLI